MGENKRRRDEASVSLSSLWVHSFRRDAQAGHSECPSSGVAMGKGSNGPPIGTGSGLSAAEEGKQVNQAKAKAGELKAGDVCFVIASTWIKQWQTYCSEADAEKPDAIDNTSILVKSEESGKGTGDKETELFEPQLKPGLAEGDDYVLVSEFEWNLLFQWYVLQLFCSFRSILCFSLCVARITPLGSAKTRPRTRLVSFSLVPGLPRTVRSSVPCFL